MKIQQYLGKLGITLAVAASVGASISITCTTVRADEPQAQNQQRFQLGDQVEVFSAGEALHGVIVGGYEDTGFGYGTYLVRLNNNYQQKYKASFVRPRFQPNSQVNFPIGASVQARRWDGNAFPGKIVGADGEKYNVRYVRNGTASTEWFHAYNLRATNQPNIAPAPNNKTQNNDAAPQQPMLPWQRHRVGDRVKYNDPGFVSQPNYGIVISVDTQKRLYQIRNEKDASLRYSYPCYAVLAPNEKINNSFYLGKWQVYTPGALTTTAITGSAKLRTLDIKADGTYVWQLDARRTVRGRWMPRKLVRGVTLQRALDGTDWTIYEKTEAFATTAKTRDEIGMHATSGRAGFIALRIGGNRSCILAGRFGAVR